MLASLEPEERMNRWPQGNREVLVERAEEGVLFGIGCHRLCAPLEKDAGVVESEAGLVAERSILLGNEAMRTGGSQQRLDNCIKLFRLKGAYGRRI